MSEKQEKSKRPFLPQGRGWIAASVLIVLLIGTVVYAQWSIKQNREQLRVEMTAAGSGSMRGMAPSFDMEPASIPKDQILSGGPPKDGIPSLTDPKMVDASEAEYLKPDDRVVGVEFNGHALAYPLRILDYHEAVNVSAGDTHFAVTYCPLCDSVTVYNREKKNGELIEFGISGLLYNSNVLLYDRQKNPDNESLWSQMKSEGVTGKSNQKELEILPYQLMTWAEWKEKHPNTKVLSKDTGHYRDYNGSAYQGYFDSESLMFPVNHEDGRLPFKKRVVGVEIDGKAKAYPIDVIREQGGVIKDTLNGQTIEIQLSEKSGDAYLTKFPENAKVINSFWFAWADFHPETGIYGRDS